MMRVIVEIHPGGDASRKKTIANIDIANMSGLSERSNYEYEAQFPETGATLRERVTGHWRDDGWLPLVQRVLMGVAFKMGLPPVPRQSKAGGSDG